MAPTNDQTEPKHDPESIAPPKESRATFKDRHGVPHTYRIERYLDAVEGFANVPKATRVVMEATGTALDSVTGYNAADYTMLGRSAAILMSRLEEEGGFDWIIGMMKYVWRSRPPVGDEPTQSDGLVWEKVPQVASRVYGGNYSEFLLAAWWFCKEEFNPFGNGVPGLDASAPQQLSAALQAVWIGEMERLFGDAFRKSTNSQSDTSNESGP